MQNVVLKADHVSKVYANGVKALDDISFEIREGEFVVIIGPSGSGKTTLLRSINKLVSLTDGEIFVDGESVHDKHGAALRLLRRKIAMIFQNYNLVYRLSVMQNVLHGRLGYMSNIQGMFGLYSEDDKRDALNILKEIELEAYACNRASELSGGQKQRVGIARALMQKPRIILCDEPIASLDPSSAKIIMDMIYAMTMKRNITSITNLHQLDVALKYATRIIGLSRGRVVFDGPPGDLDGRIIEKIYGTSMNNLMLQGNLNK